MDLSHLKVKQKIWLPVLVISFFTICIAGSSLFTIRTTLENGQIDKVRALVEVGKAIAEQQYAQYKSGLLTEDVAQQRARDIIRALVFNGGARVFAFDHQGIRVVSNTREEEGTNAWASPQTQSMIRNALSGGGVTYYKGSRSLDGVVTRGTPKAAWSEQFEPWGWVIASAVYLDDVSTAFWNKLISLASIFGLGAIVVAWAVNAIVRSITGPVALLTGNMKKLAAGNTEIDLFASTRGDEIGEMADAMRTFIQYEKERVALQEKLRHLAYRDSLTGLSNRAGFYETLQREIESAAASGGTCAVLVLDLDRFKDINDTIGHFAGDAVLVEFAARLSAAVGDEGVIGRLGGDEFSVILPVRQTPGRAHDVASNIMAALARPFDLEGTSVQVSTSIGLAFAPDDSADSHTLFRFADMALYEAKSMSGSCSRAYVPEMSRKVEKRFEMEAMIHDGLRNGEFAAHFQAKLDLATGCVVGAEALCRWRHPQKGLVSPSEFIPVAEETGQIIEIGLLMLRQACELAVNCNRRLNYPMVVAVNVSAKQLTNGQFLGVLGQCLEDTGCEAAWLELEITESLLIIDNALIIDTLQTIDRLGINIAIDDFGTGYSALSYLSRFPIKCLKIDQSFVRDICTDKQQEILVGAILAMAHGLGLTTVAEGIETEAVAEKLAAMKCGNGQGYFWHRPSSAEDFLAEHVETEERLLATVGRRYE
ncbi:MAG: EAL domain-containing protein [Allorhizobium sp.]